MAKHDWSTRADRVWQRAARALAACGLAIALVAALTHSIGGANAQSFGVADDARRWSSPDAAGEFGDVHFAPGELLIGFYEGRVLPASLLAELHAEAVAALDLRGLDGLDGDAGVTGQIVRVPVGEEWSSIEQLRRDAAVAFVEPNWLVYLSEDAPGHVDDTDLVVDDPMYEQHQWYLQRIGIARGWQLALESTVDGAALGEVRVAVVDTGIDFDHPEFAGRIVGGANYISATLPPTDSNGHGTHVAGLIGAAIDNGIGLAGAAPKVLIDPRKAFSDEGTSTVARIATAVRDAVDAGAKIVNLSVEASAPSVALEAAVQYAAEEGALLIASAGNINFSIDPDDTKVLWPAAYPDVVAVAGTDYFDQRGVYSRFGNQIELSAPGGNSAIRIRSTWPSNAAAATRCGNGYQFVDGGGYCDATGTSMSAALVSGVAALVWSMRPDLSADGVRELLRTTAHPLDADPTFVGAGRIDALAATRRALPSDLTVSRSASLLRSLVPGAQPFSVTLTLQNPSLQPVQWAASAPVSAPWLTLGAGNAKLQTGATSFGEPAYVTVNISPTQLPFGIYISAITITGTHANGAESLHAEPIRLTVAQPSAYQLFMPLVAMQAAAESFRWESPDAGGREVFVMTDNSNVGLTLPISFPLKGNVYSAIRLHSDGFLTLPASDSGAQLPNRCMPNLDAPQHAIFGWWTDLDPSALTDSRVSTFRAAPDRFVVEFADVRTAAAVQPGYVVSFQIVLHADGDVDLNYLHAPELVGPPPQVTIGVEANDGRFYHQVVCADGAITLGVQPKPRQSISIEAEEIY